MEDAATAEISRAQLWQWRVHHAQLEDGGTLGDELYCRIRDDQIKQIEQETGGTTRVHDAALLLDSLVLDEQFTEFLTIPGYRQLVRTE
jgi:malate synthase